jgi:UAA transporter family
MLLFHPRMYHHHDRLFVISYYYLLVTTIVVVGASSSNPNHNNNNNPLSPPTALLDPHPISSSSKTLHQAIQELEQQKQKIEKKNLAASSSLSTDSIIPLTSAATATNTATTDSIPIESSETSNVVYRSSPTPSVSQPIATSTMTASIGKPSNAMGEGSKSSSSSSSLIQSDAIKLMIGAGGIYGAFLYYGSLQEDVFRYVSPISGDKFKQAWLLQVLEALANVIIGWIGMILSGATQGIPLTMFAISGAAQVSAKACTSLALANGLSFPVATLAKSGKMAPVMAGSLLLGGASYTIQEYLQVAAIIGGTAIVSMGKKKGSSDSSTLGIIYILLSLGLDGVTAGFQKRLKMETQKVNVKPKPYDFMFWTNLFMMITAAVLPLYSVKCKREYRIVYKIQKL